MGPFRARPTKAATAVPTPSIGAEPAGFSSTKTPGDRYVGMRPPEDPNDLRRRWRPDHPDDNHARTVRWETRVAREGNRSVVGHVVVVQWIVDGVAQWIVQGVVRRVVRG